MKVLYAIEGLGAGGTERSLSELLPRLADRGVRPTVVCLQRAAGHHREVEERGIPIELIEATGWAGRIAEMRRLVARHRPDLVHTVLFRTDVLGRLAAAGRRTRVLGSLVSTPYAAVRFRDPRIDPGKLRRAQLADKVTARLFCDHFHAVSEAAKRAAVSALGLQPSRITVIPRGRDAARLGRSSPVRRRLARAALGLAEDDQVLVNTARHEYQKGQSHLAQAIARLAPSHPRLRLLIAGREGAMTGELREMIADLGLGARVRLLGQRDDLPEVLAAADLFVFPSLYEGLPGALIEAMALGLPVVASDIAPVREVAEEGASAVLVPPESAGDLAVAIDDMLSDRDRAVAFGERGRQIFEQRFTLERSVERTIELYRRLVEGGRPARQSGAPMERP